MKLTHHTLQESNSPKRKPMIPTRKIDHYFFPIVATYYLVTALLGFGSSTARRISEGDEFENRVILHGIFGGIWYAMFFIQVILIAAKKKKWHMKIGIYAVPIMILVFLTSFYTVLLRGPIRFEEVPFQVQGFELGLFTIGLIYVILGYIYRNNAHNHKRYFLMSIIILSGAGIDRFFQFLEVRDYNGFLIIFFVPLILLFIYDLVVYRKLFKATWISIIIFLFNMFVLSNILKMLADYLRPILNT